MTELSTTSLAQRLYRVTRALDPRDFPDWCYLDPSHPGRWDDPIREYRLLYTSASVAGAFTEVLQDLRPQLSASRTAALLAAVENDDDVDDRSVAIELNQAVVERLRYRRVGEIIPASPSDRVARMLDAPSRTWLEEKIKGDPALAVVFRFERIKVGDLIGSNYLLCRNASRLIWQDESGVVGIVAPSSELYDADCYSLFEIGANRNRPRASLTAGFGCPALHPTVRIDLNLALQLMLDPAARR